MKVSRLLIFGSCNRFRSHCVLLELSDNVVGLISHRRYTDRQLAIRLRG